MNPYKIITRSYKLEKNDKFEINMWSLEKGNINESGTVTDTKKYEDNTVKVITDIKNENYDGVLIIFATMKEENEINLGDKVMAVFSEDKEIKPEDISNFDDLLKIQKIFINY